MKELLEAHAESLEEASIQLQDNQDPETCFVIVTEVAADLRKLAETADLRDKLIAAMKDRGRLMLILPQHREVNWIQRSIDAGNTIDSECIRLAKTMDGQ